MRTPDEDYQRRKYYATSTINLEIIIQGWYIETQK